MSPEELEAAVRRFKKAMIERALGGELTHHLGYPPGGTKPEDTTNHRNGTSGKTVLTDDGPVALEVPRDRDGQFEPRLIAQARAALHRLRRQDHRPVCARHDRPRDSGVSGARCTRVDVSPDLISTVTDAVMAEVTRLAGPAARADVSRWCSSTRCA